MFGALIIHWNADPILIHIGMGGLRWYSLLFVGGFIVGLHIFRGFFRREGVDEKLLDPLLYSMLIAVIVGARLGHCIFYQPGYYFGSWAGFAEIFQPWKGGLASHGGAIGMIIAMIWYSKKYGAGQHIDFWWMMDRLAIVTCFTGTMIRCGNFFNSEIYGFPTNLPWGVVFERVSPVPVHPTMLYEALTYITLGVVLLTVYRKCLDRMYRGQFLGIFLIACFTMRFLLEFTKNPSVTVFTIGSTVINMGHILSIPFIVAGIVILIAAGRKKVPAKRIVPEKPKRGQTHYAKPLSRQ